MTVQRVARSSQRPAATFTPILARSRTLHRPIDPAAYDCVKLIFVRDGSAILLSEFGEKPVAVGDVVALAANTLCGSEPEGSITVTPSIWTATTSWTRCSGSTPRCWLTGSTRRTSPTRSAPKPRRYFTAVWTALACSCPGSTSWSRSASTDRHRSTSTACRHCSSPCSTWSPRPCEPLPHDGHRHNARQCTPSPPRHRRGAFWAAPGR